MLSKSFRIATDLTGLTVLALALAGCPTRDISQLDPNPAIEVTKPIQVKTNRQVDILFLIDNSTSMDKEQNSLAANFPKFINVLQSVPGGLPDVHIGVTSSDVGIGGSFMADQCRGFGDHGLLQNTAHGACSAPNGGARFISDVAAPGSDGGTRVKNYDGNLADVFSCIARLGTPGCGFEQHLEAVKEALDGSNPENAGFLRDGAYLAVVILGDEDDCSAQDASLFDPNPQLDNINSLYGVNASYRCTEWGVTCDGIDLPRAAASYTNCVPRAQSDSPYLWHPQRYYDFLRTLKGDPNLLIGAVIAGNPTPFAVNIDGSGAPELSHSCSSANGTADPGVRLKYFADQFGANGTFVSICQADLSDALTTIAKLLAKVIGTPCLDKGVAAVDIDPSQPGLQVDCTVSDVTGLGTSSQTETVIPRCQMVASSGPDAGVGDATPVRTTLPCWWTNIDPGTCPTALSTSHLALHVERATDTVDVTEIARCSQTE